MIVLDANILIRAVLGRRVRQLREDYAGRWIRLYAPDVAYADAAKYLPPLLIQRGKSAADGPAALHYLQTLVVLVDADPMVSPKMMPGSAYADGMKTIGR